VSLPVLLFISVGYGRNMLPSQLKDRNCSTINSRQSTATSETVNCFWPQV